MAPKILGNQPPKGPTFQTFFLVTKTKVLAPKKIFATFLGHLKGVPRRLSGATKRSPLWAHECCNHNPRMCQQSREFPGVPDHWERKVNSWRPTLIGGFNASDQPRECPRRKIGTQRVPRRGLKEFGVKPPGRGQNCEAHLVPPRARKVITESARYSWALRLMIPPRVGVPVGLADIPEWPHQPTNGHVSVPPQSPKGIYTFGVVQRATGRRELPSVE